MKRAVINLSTKKYAIGQARLRTSLIGNTDATKLFYTSEAEVGAPNHRANKYAFKPYAMIKAMEQGYTTMLWLDASMLVIKDLTPIFYIIEEVGYFWQDSGWMNDRWTTPEQKEYFGTDKGKMISSGVVGLDLTNDISHAVLQNWLQASSDGMFNGSHEVTRHDQTALSLIIEYWKLYITPNNTYWNYGKEPLHNEILILADGIV